MNTAWICYPCSLSRAAARGSKLGIRPENLVSSVSVTMGICSFISRSNASFLNEEQEAVALVHTAEQFLLSVSCGNWHGVCLFLCRGYTAETFTYSQAGWTLKDTTMPDYKKRRIELTLRRQPNGTWQCPYTIIEFRPACWAYHNGCLDGSFPSRQEAAMAALNEAKRIVDSLEPPAHGERFGAGSIGSIGRLYRNSLSQLTCVRSKSRALVTTITIFVRSALARGERKPT